MRTIEEINKKVNELYGDDYLNEYNMDFKALYETKCDEVDTLYRIIFHIHRELSLLKLKDCPEEEFKNIPLEICFWIEKLMRIQKETEVDKNGIHK